MSPPYSAVTVPVSLPREVYRILWICPLLHQSTELQECMKMQIFWEFTSGVVSAFSAYWLDSGYMYGVSPQLLLVALGMRTLFLGPLYLADFNSSA